MKKENFLGKMLLASGILLAATTLQVIARAIDNNANLQLANSYDYADQRDYTDQRAEDQQQSLIGAERSINQDSNEKINQRDPRESEALEVINNAANVAEDTCHTRIEGRANGGGRVQNNGENKERVNTPGMIKAETSNVRVSDQHNAEPNLKADGLPDHGKAGESENYRLVRDNSDSNLQEQVDVGNADMGIEGPEVKYDIDNEQKLGQNDEYAGFDRNYNNANDNYMQEQEGGENVEIQPNARVNNEEGEPPVQYEH